MRGIIINEINRMVEDYSSYSDSELLILSRKSHDAMREMIVRHSRLVRVCARPLFLAGGDNEDLVQEGMIGLLDAIRSYDPELGASFEAFAALCIRRRMISAVRAATALKHAPLNESVPYDARLPAASDPEAELIGREGLRELTDALQASLSPTERTVLSLYLEGCSYREISQRVGKPPKSVDNAVQRIRRKAAQILGENG